MNAERLCGELADSAEMIRALAAGITTGEARLKPSAGDWSVLEVICHLVDEEREDFRLRLDIILHRPAEPWPPIHPGAWVSERRYNERELPEMLEQFADERRRSLEWLRGLRAPDWEAAVTSGLRTMKAGEMLAAWVAHDNLHTRQLVELRRQHVLRLAEPYDVQYAGDW